MSSHGRGERRSQTTCPTSVLALALLVAPSLSVHLAIDRASRVACIRNSTAFKSAYGTCSTYGDHAGSLNHHYCTIDRDIMTGHLASDVCPECDTCIAPPYPPGLPPYPPPSPPPPVPQSCLAGSSAWEEAESSCSRRRRLDASLRIVGGECLEHPRQYPFLVALECYGDDVRYISTCCGGTLILPNMVVTAAHCIESVASVVIGQDQRSTRADGSDPCVEFHPVRDSSGNTAPGVRIVQHPDYDRNTVINDIAIIFLASDSSYPPISRLDLPDSEHAVDGNLLWVAGWGALSWSGGQPDDARRVQLPIVPLARCRTRNAEISFPVTDSHLCTHMADKDACQAHAQDSVAIGYAVRLTTRPAHA